jgi:sugar phosphate permease
MYLGIGKTAYSVSFFTPTILRNYGWDVLKTQAMTVPIYATAGINTIIVAFVSDRVRHRYGFAAGGLLLTLVGYSILLRTADVSTTIKYVAIYLVANGGWIAQPISIAWLNNNMGGHYKRSIAAAVQIGLGNCSGFVATNIFFQSEAPTYPTGYGTALGFICLSLSAATGLVAYCVIENKKREQGLRNYRLEFSAEERNNLGEDHPDFRYVI